MHKYQPLVFVFLFVCSLFSSLIFADEAQVEALKAKIQTRDRTLVTHVEPIYPKDAFNNNLTGSVTMSFTVNLDGSIGDIVILESTPKGVFEKASITALSQWKYAAVDKAIENVKTKFDFAP
jgi:TonB family protein